MGLTENGQQANGQPRDRSEDIRFAVVLNGGVSLAIWMSGVTNEIDTLTKVRSGDGPYGALLELLQSTARADVIAGTSAGGINGAFLALGQVFRDADLSQMGKLWTDRGALESLLSYPRGKGAKLSLMRGDRYFLQELRKSLDTVLKEVDRESPNAYNEDRPVDLFLTTTILKGRPWSFADSLGQRLCEIEHMGRFTFSYHPQPVGGNPAVNHFVGDEFVSRLALAARSTASFPGAFEPSFIPVNDTRLDGAHPDMSEVVDFDMSCFGVDGGVLLNKPIKPVLEAIWRQGAMRQVRRILLYVNPDQSRDRQVVADRPQELPSLWDTLNASINIMTMQQSAGEQIREIQSANERAERIRSTRIQVAETLNRQRLDAVPDHMFDLYRRLRARQAAMNISDRVVSAACEDGPCKKRLRSWLIEQLARTDARTYQNPPYIPPPDALKPSSPLDVNRWGIAPIERLAAFVISLLRRAIWLLPADHSLMPVVQEARRGALEDRDQIAAFRRAADIYWSEWASDDHVQALLRQVMPGSANPMAAKALKDALDYWPEGLRQWTRKQAPISPPGRPDEIVARLIGWLGVARAVSMLNEKELANVSDRGEELRRLTKPLELLGIEPNSTAAFGQPDDKVLRRLLALEVYFTLTDRNTDVKDEQMVDLVVVNADTDNSWTTTTKTAKEKLTGFKFNYFGAFYKKSWRVNDWIWGRVDAASRLTLALLNVERLWQLNVAAGDIENALRKAGWIGDLPNGARFELAEYDEQRRSGKRTITALPETAALFAELRHRDFIEGELANLNAAVEDDRENGAGTGGQGAEFAAMYRKTMSDQGQALPPWERKGRALRIFAEADICSEDFDPGTLLYQRTLSKFMRALFGVLTYASSDVGYGRILTAVPYFVPALEKPIMWTKRTINLVRTAVPAKVRLRR